MSISGGLFKLPSGPFVSSSHVCLCQLRVPLPEISFFLLDDFSSLARQSVSRFCVAATKPHIPRRATVLITCLFFLPLDSLPDRNVFGRTPLGVPGRSDSLFFVL